MRQRKIRTLRKKKENRNEVFLITIPRDIAVFYDETLFTVERSGDNVLLKSGCKIVFSNKEIEECNLEDYRV